MAAIARRTGLIAGRPETPANFEEPAPEDGMLETITPTKSFPVTWEDPTDAERYWVTDLMHYAYPKTPLWGALTDAFPRGMGKAFVGVPPAPPARQLTFNGYVYSEVRPRPAGPPAGGPPRVLDYDPSLPPLTFWEETVRPRAEALTASLKAFPFDTAPLSELVANVLGLEEQIERMGTLHHQAAMPFSMASGRFTDFCARFGIGKEEVEDLLHGVENLSLESSREQWELGQGAARNRLLLAVFEESQASEIEANLRALGEPAAELLAGVEAHVRRFGWRPGGLHPYSLPVIDDRTPVWEAVRAAATGAKADPADRHGAVVRRRQELAARVRAQLPAEAREEFEDLYARAVGHYVMMEDHNVVMDQVMLALVERACAGLSRRLFAAGLTLDERDGYFLSPEELRALDLTRPDPALQTALTERRQQWELWCTYTPPVALGRRPAEVDEFTDQFLGRSYESTGSPRILSGTPCSAGVVTGTARVLRDMSESNRLGPGEILVCITTLPPWTPLFARAGAIVTVSGGVLSHAAITAREFGIPAVLSVAGATTLIRNGQRITVDGTNGVVRLED
jgi:phosphoenolpyruvate synthase/pyruvate phosphate dikinase